MGRFALFAVICVSLGFELSAAARLLSPPNTWRFLTSKPCPFVPSNDMAAAVEQQLVANFSARSDVQDGVIQAIRRWAALGAHRGGHNDDASSSNGSPLLLTFVGPTGTGKTTTALAIAEALSVLRKDAGAGSSTIPEAQFIVHGSELAVPAGVPPAIAARAAATARYAVAQALYECHGQAVIIIDEAQKAAPGALGFLSELMSGRLTYWEHEGDVVGSGSSASSSASGGDSSSTGSSSAGGSSGGGGGGKAGRRVVLDSSRSVIIVISDVGEEEIHGWMRAAAAEQVVAAEAAAAQAGTRAASSSSAAADATWSRLRLSLLWALRGELTSHAARFGVDLGALASAVVPFMPYRQSDAQAILHRLLAREQRRLLRAAYLEYHDFAALQAKAAQKQQQRQARGDDDDDASDQHEDGYSGDSSDADDDDDGDALDADAIEAARPQYAFVSLSRDSLAALLSDPAYAPYTWDAEAFEGELAAVRAREQMKARARDQKHAGDVADDETVVAATVEADGLTTASGDPLGPQRAPAAQADSEGEGDGDGDPWFGVRRRLLGHAVLDYGARALMRGSASPVVRLGSQLEALSHESAAARLRMAHGRAARARRAQGHGSSIPPLTPATAGPLETRCFASLLDLSRAYGGVAPTAITSLLAPQVQLSAAAGGSSEGKGGKRARLWSMVKWLGRAVGEAVGAVGSEGQTLPRLFLDGAAAASDADDTAADAMGDGTSQGAGATAGSAGSSKKRTSAFAAAAAAAAARATRFTFRQAEKELLLQLAELQAVAKYKASRDGSDGDDTTEGAAAAYGIDFAGQVVPTLRVDAVCRGATNPFNALEERLGGEGSSRQRSADGTTASASTAAAAAANASEGACREGVGLLRVRECELRLRVPAKEGAALTCPGQQVGGGDSSLGSSAKRQPQPHSPRLSLLVQEDCRAVFVGDIGF